MIKVVFFDLYDTLACYDPPREKVHAESCQAFGVDISPEEVAKALPVADKFWRDENLHSPINKRSPEDKAAVYADYEVRMLKQTGKEISQELALKIMAKLWEIGLKFKPFDDAMPVLGLLKERGLKTGLISNVGQDIESTCKELGLQPYLDFKVTSFEIGYDKPRPEIFLAALDRAQAKAEEAIYVGDQYDMDILGARGVGMKAVLIDRNDYSPDVTDCPRIHSLSEIVEYV